RGVSLSQRMGGTIARAARRVLKRTEVSRVDSNSHQACPLPLPSLHRPGTPPAASWMIREAKSEKPLAAVSLTTYSLCFAIGAINHRCLGGAGATVGELRFSGADFFDCLAQFIFARDFLAGDG